MLDTLELERGGPSYSVDSLREMRRRTDSPLVLILGADAFNGFAGWKSPEQILRLAHLAVCCRPGFEIDVDLFAEHHVESAIELSGRSAGAILPLQIDPIDCSSSAVRTALLEGRTPRQLLSPAVANYIDEHNLYRKPGD
jgi:nicotinate-nucleotide adenylyltransferase